MSLNIEGEATNAGWIEVAPLTGPIVLCNLSGGNTLLWRVGDTPNPNSRSGVTLHGGQRETISPDADDLGEKLFVRAQSRRSIRFHAWAPNSAAPQVVDGGRT